MEVIRKRKNKESEAYTYKNIMYDITVNHHRQIFEGKYILLVAYYFGDNEGYKWIQKGLFDTKTEAHKFIIDNYIYL